MSETTTIESTDATATTDTTPLDSEGTEAASGNSDRPMPREQRYRLERNNARTERDALAARLESLQTAELHRLAGEHLAQPEDIGLSGKTLADLLTPEGWLDHEAVADAAAEVTESRPGLAKNPKVRAVDMSQGSGGSSAPNRPTDFSGLLNNI